MRTRLLVVNVDCNFKYDEVKRRTELAGGEFAQRPARTEDAIIAACADSAIVHIEFADSPLTARVIGALPELRAIIRYGVGIESVDQAEATRRGVVVANAADFCTEEVSDHAVALLLACARRIAFFDRQMCAGGWHNFTLSQPIRRVKCLTLGLLGWGRIAQAVARKMQGFRMRIITADPFVRTLPPESGVELVTMEQLLKESDLISVHVPLNADTKHLIGEKALRQMKPTAFVVNTSRGGVIDQAALQSALQEKRIGGAALDVFEEEPLPASSPLRGKDTVTLTPHYAASSADSMAHLDGTICDSTEAILRGFWPPFPVNTAVQPRVPLRPWSEFQARTRE
jgi:D-3-phosphoglycerate dehydrogenase